MMQGGHEGDRLGPTLSPANLRSGCERKPNRDKASSISCGPGEPEVDKRSLTDIETQKPIQNLTSPRARRLRKTKLTL